MKVKVGDMVYNFNDGMSTWKHRLLTIKERHHRGVFITKDLLIRAKTFTVCLKYDAVISEVIQELAK